jgi:crossover junction endodeoxyribonuclease RuvC
MTVLGIDPGIATVGFGAVRGEEGRLHLIGYGTIRTQPGVPLAARLLRISEDMEELIGHYKPDAVSVEELFFNTNVKTAITVAHGRGVLLQTAARCGLPVYEYTPLQVKQSVVGYGRAEKKQVMELTRLLLNMDQVPKPDDAADALAMAICHLHTAGSALSNLSMAKRD